MTYVIKNPDPYSLIISENRITSTIHLIYTVGFFIVWYAGILSIANTEKEAGIVDRVKNLFSMNYEELWQSVQYIVYDMPFLLIFLLAPLLFIRSIINNIRVVLLGDYLFFDGQNQLFHHNNKLIANFSELDRIEMNTDRSEGSKEYSLQAIHKDQEKSFYLAAKNKHDQIYNLGKDISEIVRVKFVENKEEK